MANRLPPKPPSAAEWRADQEEFASQLTRAQRAHLVLRLSALLVAVVNLAAASAALVSDRWLTVVLNLLCTALALVGWRLVGWAGEGWHVARLARIELSHAIETAVQWRTAYLQLAGYPEEEW